MQDTRETTSRSAPSRLTEGGRLQLTDNKAGNYQPAYSPNGRRIAYVGFDGSDYEIYTIKAGGEGKRQLTDNDTGDFYPSYSPSGKRIAYVSDAGTDREIYTIKPDGGGKRRVTDISTADFNAYWGVNSDCSLWVAPEERVSFAG